MANALPMPPVPLTGYLPGEMGRRSQASTRDYVERRVDFAPRRDLGPGVYSFVPRETESNLIYVDTSPYPHTVVLPGDWIAL